MIWSLLSWLSQHWPVVLLWMVVIIASAYVIGAAVWSLALAHEARQQDEQRKRLDKVMQASHKPSAPGFPHKRIS